MLLFFHDQMIHTYVEKDLKGTALLQSLCTYVNPNLLSLDQPRNMILVLRLRLKISEVLF